MSDIKLFRLTGDAPQELPGRSAAVERSLQKLVEEHMETFLAIRFLASEYSTGRRHRGRIDSLGLDENDSPVIIEYKRAMNENVVNQGLFYLDWLLDHQAEFELLVGRKLGAEAQEAVEWSNPRLLCVAGDFTRYDEYAVEQIDRNIELIRYQRYGDDLLMFELVNTTAAESSSSETAQRTVSSRTSEKTVTEALEQASPALTDRYNQLESFLMALGDDVTKTPRKNYFAFRRLRNFACVEVHTSTEQLVVYVKVDPDSVQPEDGFTRDVRDIGHFGTGDLEIRLRSDADLERAQPLLTKSYENS